MLSGPYGLNYMRIKDDCRNAESDYYVYTYTDRAKLKVLNAPLRKPSTFVLCVGSGTYYNNYIIAAATDETQAEQAARWLLDFCTVRG